MGKRGLKSHDWMQRSGGIGELKGGSLFLGGPYSVQGWEMPDGSPPDSSSKKSPDAPFTSAPDPISHQISEKDC